VFRRSRPSTEDAPAQDAANGSSGPASGADAADRTPHAVTAGKGRPTPKRSEAERRRRQPYTAPRDRKEAARAGRDRQREDRTRRMQAMRRGEEWALMPRDRGPAKALIRNYVDSRRRLSEFYMYGLPVLLALLVLSKPFPGVVVLIDPLVIAAAGIMIVEGLFLSRRARALVAQRLPAESTRGIGLYAGLRAMQPRPMRSPKPRVKPGGSY